MSGAYLPSVGPRQKKQTGKARQNKTQAGCLGYEKRIFPENSHDINRAFLLRFEGGWARLNRMPRNLSQAFRYYSYPGRSSEKKRDGTNGPILRNRATGRQNSLEMKFG